jgi:hypothetical protein
MSKRPKQNVQAPDHLVIDQTPDERGNVTVAAMFVGGRMISLGFNAN